MSWLPIITLPKPTSATLTEPSKAISTLGVFKSKWAKLFPWRLHNAVTMLIKASFPLQNGQNSFFNVYVIQTRA